MLLYHTHKNEKKDDMIPYMMYLDVIVSHTKMKRNMQETSNFN
jgi:hypothetical protein